VIRRDNIGDLVCTLRSYLRCASAFPAPTSAALVNTYNEAVLERNPAVDAVYAMKRESTRGRPLPPFAVFRRSAPADYEAAKGALSTTRSWRPREFEPRSLRLARLIGARHLLGYADPVRLICGWTTRFAYDPSAPAHEVERVFGLLKGFRHQRSAALHLGVFPRCGGASQHRAGASRLGQGTAVVACTSARGEKTSSVGGELCGSYQSRREAVTRANRAPLGHPANRQPKHPGDDDKARP